MWIASTAFTTLCWPAPRLSEVTRLLPNALTTRRKRSKTCVEKIVATKEGGAVTGEERIREKTTALYGTILNYEGRPGDYQIARIDSLKKELDDVRTEFDNLVAKDLPAINKSLKQEKIQLIEPVSRKAWNAANRESDAGAVA